MPSWELEDVVATAKANPDSFFIPSEQERASLSVGQLVRLHFVLKRPSRTGPRAERMWVEITGRITDSTGCFYVGQLANTPAAIRDLQPGATIQFNAHHVAQVWIPDDDPRWFPDMELSAFVSARVLEPGGKAGFAYREKPDRPEDSGWRLFRGDEDDEYNGDPENVHICNVGWLADRDPSLAEIFRRPAFTAYERDQHGRWKEVHDWKPPSD